LFAGDGGEFEGRVLELGEEGGVDCDEVLVYLLESVHLNYKAIDKDYASKMHTIMHVYDIYIQKKHDVIYLIDSNSNKHGFFIFS